MRLPLLKICLLFALLPHLYIQSLEAYGVIANGKNGYAKPLVETSPLISPPITVTLPEPVIKKPIAPPKPSVSKTIPVGHKPKGVVLSANIIMAWNTPENTIGHHSLSQKEFQQLHALSKKMNSNEFKSFLERGKSLSTVEFVASISSPTLQIAKTETETIQ